EQDAGGGHARGQRGGNDDDGGVIGAGLRPQGDRGSRQEGGAGAVEREKRNHGGRGGAGFVVQLLQLFHGFQPEGSGGVGQPQQVGRDVEGHRGQRRVSFGHVGKQRAQQGRQPPCQRRQHAGLLGDAADAEPEGDDGQQVDADG